MKTVKFRNIHLTVSEVLELLSLVQQKCILKKVKNIEWSYNLNLHQFVKIENGQARLDQVHMLLDMIQVAFPQINMEKSRSQIRLNFFNMDVF